MGKVILVLFGVPVALVALAGAWVIFIHRKLRGEKREN